MTVRRKRPGTSKNCRFEVLVERGNVERSHGVVFREIRGPAAALDSATSYIHHAICMKRGAGGAFVHHFGDTRSVVFVLRVGDVAVVVGHLGGW